MGGELLESRAMLSGTPINLNLNPFGPSYPNTFVEVGDVTYFVAEDGTSGRELWVTDGTAEGTRLAADIRAGAGSSFPSALVNLGGTLIFAADNGETGLELWRSDGTAEGTVLVRDLRLGTTTDDDDVTTPNSSTPQDLTVVGDKVYFTADDGVSGRELWVTDGTAGGTRLVRDIRTGNIPTTSTPLSSSPAELTAVNGVLYFTANDGAAGIELWKSDGTAAGTVLVKDIYTGDYPYYVDGDPDMYVGRYANNSNPGLLTELNGELYFVAGDDVAGAELWKSDGTADGTVRLKEIRAGAEGAFTNLDSMVRAGGLLFFTANDGVTGSELWKTDGTVEGTVQVKDIRPGAAGRLQYYTSLTAVGGMVYFAANDGVHGRELWVSDGSEAGTLMVADINPGLDVNAQVNHSYPAYLTDVDGVLYFSAFTTREGRELWKSDGTAAGTVMVEDRLEGMRGSYPSQLTAVNGRLFYSGEENNARDLWTVADEDDFTLTIVVNSEFVDIPAKVGVAANGDTGVAYSWGDAGQVLFDPTAGVTLGDFFDVWRTQAGQGGANADATLSRTELLGHVVDADHTLQMFVNGELVTSFDDYVVQDDDAIVLVYGANPVVSLNTNFGPIVMELFGSATPGTVQNFLNYVNDGDYLNSFFHRSVPSSVVQGGGFKTGSTTFTNVSQFSGVPTDAQIQNEPGISNLRGTVAMAKIEGQPNSATSHFFFNMKDNSGLDTEASGAFTVFAQVLGMATVDEIASHNVSTQNDPPHGELPLTRDNQLTVIESIEGHGDLAGLVFVDADLDGVHDDGEAGIAGLTVYVDANGNQQLDAGEMAATTDPDGRYRVQSAAGGFTLRVDFESAGYVSSDTGEAVQVRIGETIGALDFAAQSLLAPTAVDLVDASDTGADDDDNLTRHNNAAAGSVLTFLVSGVTPGAEVRLYAGVQLIGAQTASGDTVVVTTTAGVSLADGEHPITATQVVLGSESAEGPALSITIDTTIAEISSTAPDTAVINQPFEYNAQSADEGAAGVFFALLDEPSGMTIDAVTGEVSWTPGEAQSGQHDFTIVLTDLAGNSTAQSVSLTVVAAAPALPDSYEVDEDGQLTVAAGQGVLVNDGDEDSVVTSASVVTQPTHGTLAFNADGSFTYTPDEDFFGEDSFTYVGSTGAEQTNAARVTLTVVGVQDAPRPENDSYALQEDATLTVTAAEGALANDVDPDGDALTAVVTDGPFHGTLQFNADGSFVYTPDPNYSGADAFTYEVTDGVATVDLVLVSLQIAHVNDAPVAEPEGYTVDEDGVLTVTAGQGVLANDSDVEGPVTAVLKTDAAHGVLSLQADGSFTYTPDADFFGEDSFTYAASDGALESAAVTVTITVAGQPDPPAAVADAYTAPNDASAQTFAVLGNDTTDPDGQQTLTIVSVTQGTQGGSVGISGASIAYTAAEGFVGTETFTYTIQDADGLTSTATVTVTVEEAAANALSGRVYVDTNGNGQRDEGEAGVPGVTITLTGTPNATGAGPVSLTFVTNDDGSYEFTELPAGTYKLTETHPAALADGAESTTAPNATVGNDEISGIVLGGGASYAGNNFGERELMPQYHSIIWFFASSTDPQAIFREIVTAADDASAAADSAQATLAAESPTAAESADLPATQPPTASAAATATAAEVEYLTVVDATLTRQPEIGLLNAANQEGAGDGSLAIESALDEGPNHGRAEVAADGGFVYTPEADYLGHDAFTVVIKRASGAQELLRVEVSVVSPQAWAFAMLASAGDDTLVDLPAPLDDISEHDAESADAVFAQPEAIGQSI